MRLAEKLISYLHSVFDKSPIPFVAFRARHVSDDFRYEINEFALDCYIGDAHVFSANLEDHTLESLSDFIESQSGMSVVYRAPSDQLWLSARILLEGSGAQIAPNGDCFFAYSSLLWGYVGGVAQELRGADITIGSALGQLSIKTASVEWLDEWGGYFGIPRKSSESDLAYSERMIFEILRPRGNNKAIEIALASAFKYPAQIVDAPMVTKTTYWIANGSVAADGQKKAGIVQIKHYGEFDAVVGFDLMSPDSITDLMWKIREVVDGFRDAGTRLRQVAIEGKVEDVANASSDTSSIGASVDFGGDAFPAIRALADGSITAGGVDRNLCNGSIRANGATNAAGFVVSHASSMAERSVDPICISTVFDISDRMESQLYSDGLIVADGRFMASGQRGVGIDDAFITVRSMMIANGRHRVGDGVATASGAVLANRSVTCGSMAIAALTHSESTFRLH